MMDPSGQILIKNKLEEDQLFKMSRFKEVIKTKNPHRQMVCGSLLGLFTRLAAIPLITIMLVAITTTKKGYPGERWFLENDAREPHGPIDVAGRNFSTGERWWKMVAG